MEKKFSLPLVGFLQATGLMIYCGLVGTLIWQGNNLFGPPFGFWGPVLFLVLFVVSALICALIGLGHAFRLFWVEKKPQNALKLVTYTTAWLAFFVLLFLFILTVFL